MRITGTACFVFAAELGVYAAVSGASWQLAPNLWSKILSAMAAVFVMARWWGQFHSPRAPYPLRQPADAIARTAWFITGAGAAAIVMAGEWAADPLWLHLIIELAPFLAVQFTLSVLAWQFTEHRRRELDDHAQVLEK